VIRNNHAQRGGGLIDPVYDRGQLLQAENEYNKAALLPATLDEYKQVLNPILPEEPTEHPLRENRNTWMDWRVG
jgi:hypothetical protein